jgi:hypothetical protein
MFRDKGRHSIDSTHLDILQALIDPALQLPALIVLPQSESACAKGCRSFRPSAPPNHSGKVYRNRNGKDDEPYDDTYLTARALGIQPASRLEDDWDTDSSHVTPRAEVRRSRPTLICDTRVLVSQSCYIFLI